jgi:hypothetical protein
MAVKMTSHSSAWTSSQVWVTPLRGVLAECPGDGLGDFAGFLGELHDAQQLLGFRFQRAAVRAEDAGVDPDDGHAEAGNGRGGVPEHRRLGAGRRGVMLEAVVASALVEPGSDDLGAGGQDDGKIGRSMLSLSARR